MTNGTFSSVELSIKPLMEEISLENRNRKLKFLACQDWDAEKKNIFSFKSSSSFSQLRP